MFKFLKLVLLPTDYKVIFYVKIFPFCFGKSLSQEKNLWHHKDYAISEIIGSMKISSWFQQHQRYQSLYDVVTSFPVTYFYQRKNKGYWPQISFICRDLIIHLTFSPIVPGGPSWPESPWGRNISETTTTTTTKNLSRFWLQLTSRVDKAAGTKPSTTSMQITKITRG